MPNNIFLMLNWMCAFYSCKSMDKFVQKCYTKLIEPFPMFNSTANLACIAWMVTCLTADSFLTAKTGVGSWILAQSHTFVEIDHEIFSAAIFLPSIDSRRVVVSHKRKYVHEEMDYRLVKLT